MGRRLALSLLAVLVVAAPAVAGDIHRQKQRVDEKIAHLQGKIASAQHKEASLRSQIVSVTTRIRSLEAQVGDVSQKLDVLQRDLALHRARLDKLNTLYDLETRRFELLRRQYAAALDRLNKRLVQIYESNDPTTLDVLLAARSFTDALDQLDYLTLIGNQDKAIAREVHSAKVAAREAQLKTKKVKDQVQSEVQVVAVRTYQEGQVKAQLLGVHHTLTTARKEKKQALVSVQESEQEFVDEADALQKVSQDLAAKIQAAEAAHSSSGPLSTPPEGGLIWPVQGPVTSPFGMRWGRLHAGIDIGVDFGAPIHAAAAGTIIYAGWEEGYGNLVVIDHGGNLATAYGHEERIAVSAGQQVNQGDVIGYVGCTGHCFGPHLHFEVRVNGEPVDPLGYL